MTSVGSALVNRYNHAEVATYATTAPTNASTWTDTTALGAPQPTLEMGADNAQAANYTGQGSNDYSTVRRCSIDLQTRLHTGTKGFDGSGGDSDPSNPFLPLFLKSLFNGAPSAGFTGNTVAAASGAGRTAALKVTAATNMAVGMAIMVNGEVAFIKAISGTDITLNRDFSSTPAQNDVVYGAFNYTLTLGDQGTYLYQLVERDGHKWLLGPGAIMNAKLSGLASGQGLRWDWSYQGGYWTSGFAPSTFTPNAFTSDPIIGKSGQYYIDNTSRLLTEGSLDLGIQKEWRETPNGTEGLDGIEVVGQTAPTLTGKHFYASGDWDKYLARTSFELMGAFMVGSTNAAKSRGCIAFYMPNAQMVAKESTVQNQVASDVTIVGKNPQDPVSGVLSYTGLTKSLYVAVFGGR
jgi:hypothetical protein